MPDYVISGIPVSFPFEPYDVQKAYMTKVIECLNNGTNGVLESPTGTGKTLSLLCSTLAWVLNKKAEVQKAASKVPPPQCGIEIGEGSVQNDILDQLNELGTANAKANSWCVPKVIYASRTHSQLSQAMQELKRTSYSFMKAVVLGSRDQLCIHPEVSKETNNANKIQMCKIRITTRTCYYYHQVEKNKSAPELRQSTVMDIEDLVTVGRKLKMCPYFTAKELVQEADITFMPYNYLLDPKARQANKVDLKDTIVILDEAHNVEKMCEESASIQIKSSDLATAIDDLTHVMKEMTENKHLDNVEEGKDMSLEDLALLKEMILELEKAVDEIDVPMLIEGVTFPGEYMFELLAKANIHSGTSAMVNRLLETLTQYLAVKASEENSVFRKGAGLQILSDLVTIVFSGKDENKEKMFRSFKVHVQIEDQKKTKTESAKKDGWITTKATTTKSKPKILNYWCFNPGFGMEQLLATNVRSIILTSGTLAPLKPLIAELGIPISVRLENPHIVNKSQVCVKIVPIGPDKEVLNSSYRNRDNPKYISSLGRTILSFCPVIPDGLLVFFPSYPLMNKCIESWQETGIWAQISTRKPIFVEPRSKDVFTTTMNDFYANINDPNTKGAIFMAVCRGKVSEGLDFADVNGRAVVITGLPFPPLKDPRVVLKKKYLEDNRTKENELLSGDGWYSLEATRAVNQAIGRVIRHKHDYGAILLCDERFRYTNQKSQLSSWIQEHLRTSQQHPNFGPIIAEVSRFFRTAEKTLPKPVLRECKPLECSALSSGKIIDPLQLGQPRNKPNTTQRNAMKIENANSIASWSPEDYSNAAGTSSGDTPSAMDFMSRLEINAVSTIDFNMKCENSQEDPSESLITIHKRNRVSDFKSSFGFDNTVKKKKLKLVENNFRGNFNSDDLSSSSSSHLRDSSVLPTNNIESKAIPSVKSTFSSSVSNSVEDDKEIPTDRATLLRLIKQSVPSSKYIIFVKALMKYQHDDTYEEIFSACVTVFGDPCLHYLLRGMRRFIKQAHKQKFDEFLTENLPMK